VKAAIKPVVKATATPTVKAAIKPVVKATATPTVKATITPKVVQASTPTNVSDANTAPEISVPSAQTSGVAGLPVQPVPEFSLLGLGIPALLAGLVYLLIRR
jgi:carbohydrate-binding DOMON domain-containing protein